MESGFLNKLYAVLVFTFIVAMDIFNPVKGAKFCLYRPLWKYNNQGRAMPSTLAARNIELMQCVELCASDTKCSAISYNLQQRDCYKVSAIYCKLFLFSHKPEPYATAGIDRDCYQDCAGEDQVGYAGRKAIFNTAGSPQPHKDVSSCRKGCIAAGDACVTFTFIVDNEDTIAGSSCTFYNSCPIRYEAAKYDLYAFSEGACSMPKRACQTQDRFKIFELPHNESSSANGTAIDVCDETSDAIDSSTDSTELWMIIGISGGLALTFGGALFGAVRSGFKGNNDREKGNSFADGSDAFSGTAIDDRSFPFQNDGFNPDTGFA